MDLPIDARTAPFKEKYIDEETPILRRWFIFGKRTSYGGGVDISDGQQDIFVGVDPERAWHIVSARNIFVDTMLALLNAPRESAYVVRPVALHDRGAGMHLYLMSDGTRRMMTTDEAIAWNRRVCGPKENV